jgi:protein-disulfide isomerase/uncharacterized membrane protein
MGSKVNMELARLYGLFILSGLAAATAIALPFVGFGPYAVIAWTLCAVLAAAGVVPHSSRYGILAGATVAAAANAYLFWLKVNPSQPAICTVNAVIECDSINNSPASVLFGGTGLELPITLLGFAYFAGLAGSTLWAPGQTPRLFQVAALFSLFNVLVSLYLGSVLVTEGKFCVFCVSIYASNLVILWAALAGLVKHGPGLFTDFGGLATSRSFATIAATFAVVVVAGKVVLVPAPEVDAPSAGTPGTPVDLTRFYVMAPGIPEMDGSEPRQGPENARYQVVEFADYACPHCAEASEIIGGWAPRQADVAVYFKVFPLTKDCNPAIPQDEPSNFPQRCIPALYAECAQQVGRFWEVNHDLFVNQRALANAGFDVADLDLLVKNRGIDPVALKACVESTEAIRGVSLDAVSGARAGVSGTPAFFVKGILPDGSWVMPKRGAEDVIRLIDAHRTANPLPAAPGEAPAPGTPPQAPGTPPQEPAPAPPVGG